MLEVETCMCGNEPVVGDNITKSKYSETVLVGIIETN
jgi:hypothetical protein